MALGSYPQFCWADSAVETKELVVAEKKKTKQKLCTVHHLVKDKKATG